MFQQFIRHKMLLLIAYYILLVDRKAFCPYRINRGKFIQIKAKYSKILSKILPYDLPANLEEANRILAQIDIILEAFVKKIIFHLT